MLIPYCKNILSVFLCLVFLAGSTTPLPRATPTPLPKTGEEITAEIVARRCEQYRPIVEQVYEEYPVDPNLVLAVMAQESNCRRLATDGVSVGLMQVTPRVWTPTRAQLYNVRTNIEWGMYFLHSAIHHPDHNPRRDIARGLAAYNCGWVSLDANRCIAIGGPRYAERAVTFWLPYFERRTEEDLPCLDAPLSIRPGVQISAGLCW